MDNLNQEIQTLDEARQMRNLANAIRLADSFSLLFVRCNQRPRQKEIIEELKDELAGYKIKVIFLENQIEHLLDELQARLGDEKPAAIFVYGLESSFPKADEAAESKFVVTLNHSRNSFKRVLDCPLVLFLPEYALSAIYHGATDFYSIRSGVYLFSARAEDTEQLISTHISQSYIKMDSLLVEERENRIKAIEELLAEYKSLPDIQRDVEKENKLRIKLADLYTISGNYETASNINREIIDNARKSENLILLGESLNNLAIIYKTQGKYDDAIELYDEAIELAKNTIGVNSVDYGAYLNNLALVYNEQKRYSEAIKLYRKSKDIVKKIFGTYHPDYANILSNIGMVYQNQGNHAEAIKLYEESLEIIGKTLGKNHLYYANRLNNLAISYIDQGKYNTALLLFKEAYNIVVKVLGINHHRAKEIQEKMERCQIQAKKQASLIVPYKN